VVYFSLEPLSERRRRRKRRGTMALSAAGDPLPGPGQQERAESGIQSRAVGGGK